MFVWHLTIVIPPICLFSRKKRNKYAVKELACRVGSMIPLRESIAKAQIPALSGSS